MISLFTALALAIFICVGAKITRMDKRSGSWTVLLLLLVLIYPAFGLITGWGSVVYQELIYASPFLIFFVFRQFHKWHWVSLAFLIHALYAQTHTLWVYNPEIPVWYKEIDGLLSFFIGGYLLTKIRLGRT